MNLYSNHFFFKLKENLLFWTFIKFVLRGFHDILNYLPWYFGVAGILPIEDILSRGLEELEAPDNPENYSSSRLTEFLQLWPTEMDIGFWLWRSKYSYNFRKNYGKYWFFRQIRTVRHNLILYHELISQVFSSAKIRMFWVIHCLKFWVHRLIFLVWDGQCLIIQIIRTCLNNQYLPLHLTFLNFWG